jgi:hypothetical protein
LELNYSHCSVSYTVSLMETIFGVPETV